MLKHHDDAQRREEKSRAPRLRLAVGIATVGRPTVLAGMLKRLRQQKRPADSVVVCAPSSADFEGIAEAFPDVTLRTGPRGLAHQRNAILRHLHDSPETQEVFGELFLRAYSAVKLDEFEEFNQVISSWEREHLLLQV